MLASRANFLASSTIPRSTPDWIRRPTFWRARSIPSASSSNRTTEYPAKMQAYAIPAPIVPPPTTPIFVMSAGWFSIPLGNFAARSAKNICRNARAWGSVLRVRKALRSFCIAASSGNSEPSFVISSAHLGAFWPTIR